MPGFDGTGPRGQGPIHRTLRVTGRGEGHCVLVLPSPGTGEATYGYAGLPGTPMRLDAPATLNAGAARFARWPRPMMWPGRIFGNGRGRGAGRGRGRWAGWR